jgi:hypothetical protein
MIHHANDFPTPIVEAGKVPFDHAQWLAAKDKPKSLPMQQVESPTLAEQSWAEFFNKAAADGLVPNPVFLPPVTLHKKCLPGSEAQRQQYIHAFEDANPEITAFVRQCRYKAVYQRFPDGSKDGPEMPPVKLQRGRELAAQVQGIKYLKWFEQTDPAAFEVWIHQNLNFWTQFRTDPKPEQFTATPTDAKPATLTTLADRIAARRENRAA